MLVVISVQVLFYLGMFFGTSFSGLSQCLVKSLKQTVGNCTQSQIPVGVFIKKLLQLVWGSGAISL